MKAGKLIAKTQIIEIVSEGTGLTKVETAAVIDGFLATITWAVSNDRRVALRGFGSFDSVQRRERTTRNPRTGEKMTVAARRAVTFRPAKELRGVVNQSTPEEKPSTSVVEETK
jgi:nucleoid DNA-binding protein